MFLFGSYAWGSPNEDSDLDFAVVAPDDEYVRRIDIKARKLNQHGLIPIDVLAYRSSTFESSVQERFPLRFVQKEWSFEDRHQKSRHIPGAENF